MSLETSGFADLASPVCALEDDQHWDEPVAVEKDLRGMRRGRPDGRHAIEFGAEGTARGEGLSDASADFYRDDNRHGG
jgi:hypothetical protein